MSIALKVIFFGQLKERFLFVCAKLQHGACGCNSKKEEKYAINLISTCNMWAINMFDGRFWLHISLNEIFHYSGI